MELHVWRSDICKTTIIEYVRWLFDAIFLTHTQNCAWAWLRMSTSVGVLTSSVREGTLGLISVSHCWSMWKSLDDNVCVCTKIVCSHPPVEVYFIDSHASMLPVFMDSACICVCSTYGVHSLGKAFISSWVYSLSFLGISRGWGSSSVRFARRSSGSSWGAVGEGTEKTRNKRADFTFQSL